MLAINVSIAPCWQTSYCDNDLYTTIANDDLQQWLQLQVWCALVHNIMYSKIYPAMSKILEIETAAPAKMILNVNQGHRQW